MSEGNVPQGEAVFSINSVAVAQLTNVEFSGSTSEIDYTNNDSPLGTGEFIPGKRDPGSITADFVASSTNADAIHDHWLARTVLPVSVEFWDTGFTKVGNGFVSEFSLTSPLEGEDVTRGSFTVRMQNDEAAGS